MTTCNQANTIALPAVRRTQSESEPGIGSQPGGHVELAVRCTSASTQSGGVRDGLNDLSLVNLIVLGLGVEIKPIHLERRTTDGFLEAVKRLLTKVLATCEAAVQLDETWLIDRADKLYKSVEVRPPLLQAICPVNYANQLDVNLQHPRV